MFKTIKQLLEWPFADVHNGKMSCSTSRPAQRFGDSEKQFAKQRESSERRKRRRVNIEQHIPRSLNQRSALCVAFFSCLMCNITMCPGDGHQLEDKVKVSCVIVTIKGTTTTREHVVWFFWPATDRWLETEANVLGGYELHVLFERSIESQAYTQRIQEPKRGNINTRFIKTQAESSYHAVRGNGPREFVYTTIACFIFFGGIWMTYNYTFPSRFAD